MPNAQQKPFEIILWGATSFVGQLTAKFLFQRHGAGGDLRWAIAGRNQAKLEALMAELGDGATALPMLLADAHDPESLRVLVSQTQVILTTVGPYLKYGKPLVAACVEAGTDYCDLTGEIPFIREMMDQHAAQAKATGARIVHCTGVDSIPSDLGVYFLNRHAQTRFGEAVQNVTTHVDAFERAFSGGTLASLVEILEAVQHKPNTLKILRNPYAICPAEQRHGPRQPDLMQTSYDTARERWLSWFFMAQVNVRVVHASNALLDYPYTKNFIYDELMGANSRMWAYGRAYFFKLFYLAMANQRTRALLNRFVLPNPGQGPSVETQENGFFVFRLYGTTVSGQTVMAEVTGDRDPGYGSTAKMAAETALCLARDIPKSEVGGGFWTPASALGIALIDRLIAHAGITFDLVDDMARMKRPAIHPRSCEEKIA